jgi:hypothetical protein
MSNVDTLLRNDDPDSWTPAWGQTVRMIVAFAVPPASHMVCRP